MLKSLTSVMFVIAVVIFSVLSVGAVNEPTAPTEYITEFVTEVATEAPTEVVTDVTTHTVYEVLCFILFGVAILVGIKLAHAFSFWKW